MPRPRPPGSLKQQCVRNIVAHMDSFWCQDYIKNWMGHHQKLLYVLGPFEDLPSSLVGLIIEELIKTGRMKKHHLHLLLLYHLESLQLSADASEYSNIIQLIGIRCKKLRHLGLKNRSGTKTVMNELFVNLEYLQTVDLSQSAVCDPALAVIGAYAKHLRVLNLADTEVTDIGVSSLCHGIKSSFIPPNEKTTVSKTLVKLNLYGTPVTTDGIQCALVNMPNLKELIHSSLLFAASSLEKSRERMMEEKAVLGGSIPILGPLGLKNLQSDVFGCTGFDTYSDADYIASAIKLCPDAQYLQLKYLTNVKSDSLLPILNLNGIVELVLIFSEDEHVDYMTQIEPLLLHHGPTLQRLYLYNVQNINIVTIGMLCPELKILELSENSYLPDDMVKEIIKLQQTNNKQQTPIFSQLRTLDITSFGDGILQVTPICLSLMLTSPFLEKLTIVGQEYLTDQILHDFIFTTGVRCLKYVNFTLCKSITSDAIWWLIHRDNPLSELHLIENREITRNHYNKFQKISKNKKLMLHITWA